MHVSNVSKITKPNEHFPRDDLKASYVRRAVWLEKITVSILKA